MPVYSRKPRHLLSGLCRCGVCGGSYIVQAQGQLGCSNRKERGTCTNRRMISIRLIEKRVLEALQRDLLHDEVVAAAIREYALERQKLRAQATQTAKRTELELRELNREIERTLDLIVKEGVQSAIDRLKDLEARRETLKAGPLPEQPAVEIHPQAAEGYRTLVQNLRERLRDADDDQKAEAFAMIRQLIDRVVIYPRDDERDLELHGRLAALLQGPQAIRTSMVALVAGAGFEPTTFRL